MQAQQYAFGNRRLLAPESFRRALKRAFPDSGGGEVLDCWFDPRATRIEIIDGTPVKATGAWIIWTRVRVQSRIHLGGNVSMSCFRYAWADAMRLDGSFGLPTTPGKWTIQALQQSNMKRRPGATRNQELDRMNVEAHMAEFHEREQKIRELQNDKLWGKVVRQQAERLGSPVLSGDEKARFRRLRAAAEARAHEKAEKEAALFRFGRRM